MLKPIPNPPVKRHVQKSDKRRHPHNPRASIAIKGRIRAQTSPQQSETRQQDFQMGGNIRCIEPRGIGCLLGPYLPEDAEVRQGGEVDGSSVLDCGSYACECCHAVVSWYHGMMV